MAITHAAGLAAVDAGAEAILCCTRSGRTARAMARFRPSGRLIGLSPDPATVRALALSWGVRSLHVVDVHNDRRPGLVRGRAAVQSGLVESGETVLVLAGAPDRPSGAAPTCCVSCASRDAPCGPRRPATRTIRWSCSCTARWTARPGMLKLSRRLDTDFRVLRYDRRGYGRSSRTTVRSTWTARSPISSRLLAGRPAVLVGHSYGGNVALAAAARHPELVAGVAVYETPLSWEPWWPGTTAGASAVAAAGQAARRRPSASCAG